MIVHVVMGTVNGGYDSWPDVVVCGVFSFVDLAWAHITAEQVKQRAHDEWRERCRVEKNKLKPAKSIKREMTVEQRLDHAVRSDKRVRELAGPEPECSQVTYLGPITLNLDTWSSEGLCNDSTI